MQIKTVLPFFPFSNWQNKKYKSVLLVQFNIICMIMWAGTSRGAAVMLYSSSLCFNNTLSLSWRRHKILETSFLFYCLRVDMIVSRNFCRLDICTSLFLDSTGSSKWGMTCWAHCHVPALVLDGLCSCETEHYLLRKLPLEEAKIVAKTGSTWSATIPPAVAFKLWSIGAKGPELCQENTPHTITAPPPPAQSKSSEPVPTAASGFFFFWLSELL